MVEPLRGANSSTQYNAIVGYESLIDGHVEAVSIEVSVREPNMMDVHAGVAQTALRDPIDGQVLVQPHAVLCLSSTPRL